jgi:hypothetical protein
MSILFWISNQRQREEMEGGGEYHFVPTGPKGVQKQMKFPLQTFEESKIDFILSNLKKLMSWH